MKLIDADALCKVIEDHVTNVSVCPSADWAMGKTQFKKMCLEDIKSAPAVDAAPVVHGRWIETEPDPEDLKMGFDLRIECSLCHEENSHLNFNDVCEIVSKTFTRSKYCQNCGAYMWGDSK